MSKVYTTLNRIREFGPCGKGWENLLKGLNKTKADDELLAFSTIARINNVRDALWCTNTISDKEEIKQFYLLCASMAERALPIFEKKYPDDKRPRLAIQAIRDFMEGKITREELRAAADAAYDAADDAADAAAAYSAASAAAYSAYAYDAVDAADSAGDAAAYDAAYAAADAAASYASYASCASAYAAYASYASYAAADAAYATADAAARVNERQAQIELIEQYLS